MTVVVYGISNCDQVRKTLGWLNANDVEHRFHDFRRDGLERARLERWCSHVPWTALLNKRGQTWRALPEEGRRQVVDQASAVELMLAQPTLVKRPVIEIDEDLLIGFSAERLRETLDRHGAGPAAEAGAEIETQIETQAGTKAGSAAGGPVR